jgi:hypothetical protein
MQPGSVHIHYKERPEERILSRLGPKKDDLRSVGGKSIGASLVLSGFLVNRTRFVPSGTLAR